MLGAGWAGAERARSTQAGVGRSGRGAGAAGSLARRRGAQRARGTAGARACGAGGSRRGRGAQQAGRRGAGRARQAGTRRMGRAGWLWAVHSVHSACFWPGSTRYFSSVTK